MDFGAEVLKFYPKKSKEEKKGRKKHQKDVKPPMLKSSSAWSVRVAFLGHTIFEVTKMRESVIIDLIIVLQGREHVTATRSRSISVGK